MMKQFMASPSGQNIPVSVALVQNISNGDNTATHQINVVYPSLEVTEQSNAAYAQSADGMRYMTTLRQSADHVSENMFSMEMAKMNVDLSGQTGAVSMLTLMSVSDPATFTKAFQKLMASSSAGDFPGDIYFGRIIGAGENPATHWINASVRNMSDFQSKKVIIVADALESDSTRELSTNVGEPQIMVSWPNARSNENDTVAITQPMDRCESEFFNI